MNIEIGNNLRTWTVLCAILCVLTVGVAAFHFTTPTASPKTEERRGKANLERAIKSREQSEIALAEAEAVSSGMWQGAPETITSQILQSVTVIAKTQGVNLKSFRPQNAIADGNLSRNNYVVLLEGSFPQVIGFIKALDTPSSRLGVSLIQISAADQETDKVNATVGVIAYVKMPEVETTKAKENEKGSVLKQTDEKVAPKTSQQMNDSKKQTSVPEDN